MNHGGGRRLVREMGYSLQEFGAVLPAAMRGWRVDGGPSHWQVFDERKHWLATIGLQPQPPRRLGSLSVPVLVVTLELTDSQGVAEEFLRRFDRGFHRGGG